jgi:hypothetical protein
VYNATRAAQTRFDASVAAVHTAAVLGGAGRGDGFGADAAHVSDIQAATTELLSHKLRQQVLDRLTEQAAGCAVASASMLMVIQGIVLGNAGTVAVQQAEQTLATEKTKYTAGGRWLQQALQQAQRSARLMYDRAWAVAGAYPEPASSPGVLAAKAAFVEARLVVMAWRQQSMDPKMHAMLKEVWATTVPTAEPALHERAVARLAALQAAHAGTDAGTGGAGAGAGAGSGAGEAMNLRPMLQEARKQARQCFNQAWKRAGVLGGGEGGFDGGAVVAADIGAAKAGLIVAKLCIQLYNQQQDQQQHHENDA